MEKQKFAPFLLESLIENNEAAVWSVSFISIVGILFVCLEYY